MTDDEDTDRDPPNVDALSGSAPPGGSQLPTVNWIDEPKETSEGVTGPIRRPDRSVDLHRESTRSQLARWLMALLTVTVLSLLALGGLQMGGAIGTGQISIKDLGQLVLSPVVTLTGTALGFYYGTQSHSGAVDGGGTWPTERPPGLIRRGLSRIW